MKYCHSHHVVHRDIKLENFVFDSTDENTAIIKLLDFGLSKELKVTLPGEEKRQVSRGEVTPKAASGGGGHIANNTSLTSPSPRTPRKRKIQRMESFVGTSYYVPPEMVKKKGCVKHGSRRGQIAALGTRRLFVWLSCPVVWLSWRRRAVRQC